MNYRTKEYYTFILFDQELEFSFIRGNKALLKNRKLYCHKNLLFLFLQF